MRGMYRSWVSFEVEVCDGEGEGRRRLIGETAVLPLRVYCMLTSSGRVEFLILYCFR